MSEKGLACDPETESLRLFECKHAFVRVLGGEIDRLRWEVANDICAVSAPD